MLAPISWRVPPVHYGPWELFASLLTEGLVDRGHDVTLFATADSVTAAALASVVPHGWSEASGLDPKVAECLHIASCFERADEFDIIHNGFDFLPLTYSGLVDTPVVTTIHGFSSPQHRARVRAVRRPQHLRRHQRLRPPPPTALRGDDPPRHRHDARSRVHPSPGDHLLFFGRIHPDKGTAAAIEVARRGRAAARSSPASSRTSAYFDGEVAPHLDGDRVRYVGPVVRPSAHGVLGGAHALLHLIDFDEPFGFSVVEAMACGTPVVAYDRGSMRELVDDGVTGFVVDDIDAAVAAVSRVDTLDRHHIRSVAVERFSRDRMVDEYVDVYRTVLAAARAGKPRSPTPWSSGATP